MLTELASAGWVVYPTGGNCEALVFEYPDGLKAWVTDANGPTIPDDWASPCVLGFYRGDEEEPLVEFRCAGVREAVEMARKRVSTPAASSSEAPRAVGV